MAYQDQVPSVARRLFDRTPRLLGVLVAIIGWQLLASVFPNELMPFPLEVILLVQKLFNEGNVISNLYITYARTLSAFFISLFIGLVLGFLMGISEPLKKTTVPYLFVLLSVPAAVWLTTTVIIFGFTLSNLAIVLTAVLIAAPYLTINILNGVEAIDMSLVEMSQGFGISSFRTLVRVVIPNIYPVVFSSFRFGLGIAWSLTTVGEYLIGSNGIGYQISSTYENFLYEEAWAWALIFIATILVIEYLIFKPLERRAFGYRDTEGPSYIPPAE